MLSVFRCNVVLKVVVLSLKSLFQTTDNIVVGVVSVVVTSVVVSDSNLWHWFEVGKHACLTPLANEVSLVDFGVVRKVVTPLCVSGQVRIETGVV